MAMAVAVAGHPRTLIRRNLLINNNNLLINNNVVHHPISVIRIRALPMAQVQLLTAKRDHLKWPHHRLHPSTCRPFVP